MRYRSVLPGAVALSALWLAACGNDTPTAPTQPAEPARGGADMAVASNSWITRAPLPTKRLDLATATVTNAAGQSIVYAIGGVTFGVPVANVDAYNVATNTWSSRRSLPGPLAASNGAGVINGKIYISGGYANQPEFPSNGLAVYDPATNTWTSKRPMPVATDEYGEYQYPGGGGVTGVIGGKLYVVSKCFEAQEPWGYFDTCPPVFLRYNPATNQWVTLPPLPPYGDITMAGVINGKFYIMGAVYDPATNHWTKTTPLRLYRGGAASAVLEGKLYMMGGRRYNAKLDTWEVLDVTIAYDPVTDTWTPRAPLPGPRERISATKVFLNGKPRIELVGSGPLKNNLQYVP
jgi:N-acetylneuraminic acid mutarotase